MILEREQYYLTNMKCAEDPTFYNISPTAGGGDCGNGSKISRTKKERFKSGELAAYNKGIPMSNQQKEKLSDVWQVRTPAGDELVIANMREYCQIHNLNPSAMSSVARGNRSNHKGYWCKKISNNRDVSYTPREWTSKGHGSKAVHGSRNGMSKPIEIDGVVYDTMSSAAKGLGISMYLLRKRISNDK